MIGGDGPIVRSEPYLLDADEYPFTIAMFKKSDPSVLAWAITVLRPMDSRLHLLKIPPGRVWIGAEVDVSVMNPGEWPVGWTAL